jgi:organic hydroperoxide reductase OsmC/OhrA
MNNQHQYTVSVEWTGNLGKGTADYVAYSRDHIIQATRKPLVPGSSDPSFRGDGSRYNPEEFLIASISACHMLWYLHLCADSGIVITRYNDHAIGTLILAPNEVGYFSEVVLRPNITITDPGKMSLAHSLHAKANKRCFIANSCKFPVHHEPIIQVEKSFL